MRREEESCWLSNVRFTSGYRLQVVIFCLVASVALFLDVRVVNVLARYKAEGWFDTAGRVLGFVFLFSCLLSKGVWDFRFK